MEKVKERGGEKAWGKVKECGEESRVGGRIGGMGEKV